MSGAGYLDDTATIIDQLNARAGTLGPELLPNGHRSGNLWRFSGIADHGGSTSAWLHLSGPKEGQWVDAGNAAPGEDKGDMLDLLRLIECGGDKRRAFDRAREILGLVRNGQRVELTPAEREQRAEEARKRREAQEAKLEAERKRKAKGAKALFLSGVPIADTGAGCYLTGRDLSPGPLGRWPGCLRFHAEVWHGALQMKMPALLGAIYRADGAQIGTHRIFLSHHHRAGWAKLQGVPAKMVLGNMWGGFVPINKGASGKSMRNMPEGEPLYVTEGIEDAVAVRMIKPEARIVAAISLGNIGAIVLPPAARNLVIVADRDEKGRAQDALEAAIAQQQARGLSVSTVFPPREVAGEKVKDINDWVRVLARQAKGKAA